MAAIIIDADIPSSVKSDLDPATLVIMLAGANASAGRVAPCLVDTTTPPTADQLAEAKLVLLGAVTRWSQAGAGGVTTVQQGAGPFQQSTTTDNRPRSGYKLWPSEIAQLQDICKGQTKAGAFSIDTAPSLDGQHAPWCALAFGATYCSCGVDIAGYPIFETA